MLLSYRHQLFSVDIKKEKCYNKAIPLTWNMIKGTKGIDTPLLLVSIFFVL